MSKICPEEIGLNLPEIESWGEKQQQQKENKQTKNAPLLLCTTL